MEIAYGGADGNHFTFRKRYSSNTNQDYIGGPSNQDLSAYSSRSDLLAQYQVVYKMVAYLKCLESICEPSTKIKSATVTTFDNTQGDWNDREVAAYAAFDFANFLPKAGNTPKSGPRGSNFIGSRQLINASHRYGWMRWHYIAGNILQLPEVIPLALMPVEFQEFFPALRDLGGGLGPYASLTSVFTPYLATTDQGLPEASFHQGIRNG